MATKKKTATRKRTAKINQDGWNNALTKIGSSRETSATKFSYDRQLPQTELEAIYAGDGIGRKIVDLPVDEMIREWITVEKDTEGLVLKEFSEIDVKSQIAKLMRWSRLYGGAMMLMGLDDGLDLANPFSAKTFKRIRFLRVYDRHQITWTTSDLNENPSSKYYGKPEYYNVQPLSGTGFRVHRSRVFIMDGEDLPDRLRQRNQGWGASSLQSAYRYLMQFSQAMNGSSQIIKDFVQTVLQINGLQQIMASGQEDLVHKRVELLDLTRSIMNTIFLDDKETYQKISSSVAGLPELIEKFMLNLSAVTNIPASKLFGRSPAGMNATGESDMDQWYDFVSSQQSDHIKPILDHLIWLVTISKEGPFKGKEQEDFEAVFKDLYEPTEKEQVDIRKTQSEIDHAYWNMGVLDADEIRESRFGGDAYSHDTHLLYQGAVKEENSESVE